VAEGREEAAGEAEAAGEDAAASGGWHRHDWGGIYVYARIAVGDGSELGGRSGGLAARWERIAVVGLGEKIHRGADGERRWRDSRGECALCGRAGGGRRRSRTAGIFAGVAAGDVEGNEDGGVYRDARFVVE